MSLANQSNGQLKTLGEVATETVLAYSGSPEDCALEAGLPLEDLKVLLDRDADSSIRSAVIMSQIDGAPVDLEQVAKCSFLNGMLIGIAWARSR